jgi:hypothetical protein
MTPLVTLITDFGPSEYVGAMKGVIHSICPKTRVIDIAHGIGKFDIRRAAYAVYSSCKYFPKGTIHLVVVDPGVGTERRGIILETEDHLYIGPDNGVFSLVEDIKKIYEISYPSVSKTFHGRDVFAPIAAKLACGAKADDFGREVEGFRRIEFRKVGLEEGTISGEVLCIDDFGNIITNIKKEVVDKAGIRYGSEVTLKAKGERRIRFLESYGFAETGELISLIGSEDFLEIAVNQGNASERLGIKGGDGIEVSR